VVLPLPSGKVLVQPAPRWQVSSRTCGRQARRETVGRGAIAGISPPP